MITDFKGFGLVHIVSLLVPLLIGAVWTFLALRHDTVRTRRQLRLAFAALLIAIRGARYLMDVYFGVFEWEDLFSLHICHIDLLLLIVCLVRPNRALFNFCFLIGIPTALSVALFPGSDHPAPGLPRAVLFIMSHMMLAGGAVYLALTERMKPMLRMFFRIAIIGNFCLIPVYFVNSILDTNYLYIMEAPSGTALVAFQSLFGWPGYVFALDALALVLMFLMLGLGRLLHTWSGRARQGCPTAAI